MIRARVLTSGVVSVLTNCRLLAAGAPIFAVLLPINARSTERYIRFDMFKLERYNTLVDELEHILIWKMF